MKDMLQAHAYHYEDGLYYWDGGTNEELSMSERVIMSCLKQHGPVVHGSLSNPV